MSESAAEDPPRGPGTEGAPSGTGELHRKTAAAYDRTWELELLISGAVVFALLQFPSALDRWFWRVDPHLVGAAEESAFFVYFYSKLIVYTLVATFVVHLCSRAYWV